MRGEGTSALASTQIYAMQNTQSGRNMLIALKQCGYFSTQSRNLHKSGEFWLLNINFN